jgi:hypothetical protein
MARVNAEWKTARRLRDWDRISDLEGKAMLMLEIAYDRPVMEPVVRVHTAEALEATEVKEADVKAFLAEAAERTRLGRDRAAGQENLDLKPSRVDPDAGFDPKDLPDGDE